MIGTCHGNSHFSTDVYFYMPTKLSRKRAITEIRTNPNKCQGCGVPSLRVNISTNPYTYISHVSSIHRRQTVPDLCVHVWDLLWVDHWGASCRNQKRQPAPCDKVDGDVGQVLQQDIGGDRGLYWACILLQHKLIFRTWRVKFLFKIPALWLVWYNRC